MSQGARKQGGKQQQEISCTGNMTPDYLLFGILLS